jgi:hypothetical protein
MLNSFATRHHGVLLLGIMLITGCSFPGNTSATLQYIRRVTAVNLPANVTVIAEFDQGEWETGGKYRLQKEDIEPFLLHHPFIPVDELYQRLTHYNQLNETEQIPFSDSTHLKYFTGCKKGNAWLFTLNVSTGELWIEVQYPDWAGQAPPCD